jgi:hypothetical protein
MPFCQTAPLLSSVAWKQNLSEYWREDSASTAISTVFASDGVGQHNKIGGITFGTTYVLEVASHYERGMYNELSSMPYILQYFDHVTRYSMLQESNVLNQAICLSLIACIFYNLLVGI